MDQRPARSGRGLRNTGINNLSPRDGDASRRNDFNNINSVIEGSYIPSCIEKSGATESPSGRNASQSGAADNGGEKEKSPEPCCYCGSMPKGYRMLDGDQTQKEEGRGKDTRSTNTSTRPISFTDWLSLPELSESAIPSTSTNQASQTRPRLSRDVLPDIGLDEASHMPRQSSALEGYGRGNRRAHVLRTSTPVIPPIDDYLADPHQLPPIRSPSPDPPAANQQEPQRAGMFLGPPSFIRYRLEDDGGRTVVHGANGIAYRPETLDRHGVAQLPWEKSEARTSGPDSKNPRKRFGNKK